jgi:Ni2+-binding GTPase involved in maturation of urease and hydrogenase
VAFAREVNPELEFYFTSATTGSGLEEWFDFIRRTARSGRAPASAPVAARAHA